MSERRGVGGCPLLSLGRLSVSFRLLRQQTAWGVLTKPS